jgi:hypothetical protein
VDYVAPAMVPTPDPVTVQAVSAADVSKSGTSQVTIINHVLVTVLPGSALVVPLGVQPFVATVLGTDNQNVVWQIQGAGCSSAGICGAITPAGVYTAPGAAPTPDALQVVAISSEDPSQSGSANVTIYTGVNILTLHPASVYAGAANGFTLKVIGTGFAASTSGTGAILLIGGTARTTTCSTAQECIAPVTAADVGLVGNVSVQVQNPGGRESNALVVAVPNASDDVISLSAGAPEVSGKDIVVVEPTTAGESIPGNDVDLDVAALGSFSAVNNSCTLGGNPVMLTRPQKRRGHGGCLSFFAKRAGRQHEFYGDRARRRGHVACGRDSRAHVVAVDAASGAVVGATVGGWSRSDPGLAQFDGSYAIERLPTGSSYLVYAEPLNGAVDPSEISNATASLCRNSTSDPGWPSLQGCVVPPVDVSFTVRTQPGP